MNNSGSNYYIPLRIRINNIYNHLSHLPPSIHHDPGILLAEAQIQVDSLQRCWRHRCLVLLEGLGVVLLGADEVAGVADATSSVGHVVGSIVAGMVLRMNAD